MINKEHTKIVEEYEERAAWRKADCAALQREAMKLRDMWHKILSTYMKCEGDAQPVMDAVAECRSIMLEGEG